MFSQNQTGKYKKKFNTQSLIYGKVDGVIKDQQTKENLPFTDVALFQNDSLINGTITDEKGYFFFNKLAVADYTLQISYVGYKTQVINFSITNNKLNKKLKNIYIESITQVLDNVELSDQAPIFENKIEKIVYNAQNDLSSTANDGIDVLRNAPLVEVDIDDKVSIRGSSNVKFLLNGKTSSFLSMDNISDVLQSIPAEQIKSIEVITSPGAKYDAEGDAGIINIVTNQKNIEGFNAGVNTNTGTRVNRSSFNLNAGENRFGISASGGARYGWPRRGNLNVSNIVYNNMGDITSSNIKNGQFIGNWVGYRASVDVYYDVNKYNSITSNFHINGQNKVNESEENVLYQDLLVMNPIQYIVADTSYNKDTEYELTVNYMKKFENDVNRELVVSFQYGSHIHDDNKDFDQLGYEDVSIDNNMYGKGYELTGQVDYTHPIGNDHKIELGVKQISRYTNNDYNTDLAGDNMSNLFNNYSLTNILNYSQIVSAAYLSTQFKVLNDFDILAGTRYELTNLNVYYMHSYSGFHNSYENIVPSLTIAKKLNMFKTIKLSYTNRIQRPDIHKINTNTEIIDLNTISTGNPNLKPSQSHQLELGYTSFQRGLMTSFFLYYKAKYDVIEAFTYLIDDNIFETNYLNTGNNHSYGFNFYGSATIKNNLTLRGSVDIYTYNMSTSVNSVNLLRNSLNYKYSFNANLKLGNGYNLESRAFFRSPRQTIQGERPSFSMLSFGFKKEFSNKRGSVGIGVIEPFSKYKSFDTNISGQSADGTTYDYIRDYEILFRSFNISLKYKFGQLNFDPIKKKAKVVNNDLIEDDGGEY